MMQQYLKLKEENPGAILFFRLGDFYEMFNQDAIEASKILGITLTARNKKSTPTPMCGVPHHSAENYITRLTKAGRKVAICEQTSDPTLPGIVTREVVRIITPGTTFSDQILEGKSNRYVLALFPAGKLSAADSQHFGFAFADLTTGEFRAAEAKTKEALELELLRLNPVEIVLGQDHYDHPDLRADIATHSDAPISRVELYEEGSRTLKEHFKLSSLEGFGIANWPFAVQAAAVLLRYLVSTQKDSLQHLDRIRAYHREHWMQLDQATLRNLELFSTIRSQDEGGAKSKGTLHSVLDHTQTAFGGRLLKRWLLQPLTRKEEIEARHDAVEAFLKNPDWRSAIKDTLKNISDLERLLSRLSTRQGNARDALGLAKSLEEIPQMQTLLTGPEISQQDSQQSSRLIQSLQKDLLPLQELTQKLTQAISQEAPLKLTEGGLIQTGYNAQLDELRALMQDGKSALRAIEEQERESTGINSLKVSYNRVFGYYIEVTKLHSAKVPEHYVRKQTLTNAERYITDELKIHEEKVLGAQEKAKQLEQELFHELRMDILTNISAIKQNAAVLAQVDVLLCFAEVAQQNQYCKPEILAPDSAQKSSDKNVSSAVSQPPSSPQTRLHIESGRHPVVEHITLEKRFVPNDAHFTSDESEVKLITGPNMSGKSTYLRQVALITLMAQIGSYVPASSLQMQVFDRIFTRVGASDNLVGGQSTFMVEMQESAYILHHATPKSLVILDEVGRGTSTYDGMSLAWSILEHLHDHIRPTTLFATHYHELIELTEKLPRAENLSVDVQETKTGILFLHKIKKGGIDQSYGIEVAKLAGVPKSVIQRAQQILSKLEKEKLQAPSKVDTSQMDLFSRTYASTREPGKVTHPALERLKNLDINELTPLQALNALSELKKIREED